MTAHELEACLWIGSGISGLLILLFTAWMSRRQQDRDGNRDYATHRNEVH